MGWVLVMFPVSKERNCFCIRFVRWGSTIDLADGHIYGTPVIRYIAAATAPAQGFLNCIVFLSTNSRARKWLFCGSCYSSRNRVRSSFEQRMQANSAECTIGGTDIEYMDSSASIGLLSDRQLSECSVDSDILELDRFYGPQHSEEITL